MDLSSELKASGPEWARGCPQCKFGIVSAPELTRACDLHMERLVQAMSKSIEFCTCQAGTRYRVYLLNRRQILLEEARREAPNDERMMAAMLRGSHPDIEIAAWQIEASYAMMPAPTVHFVAAPAPAPELAP